MRRKVFPFSKNGIRNTKVRDLAVIDCPERSVEGPACGTRVPLPAITQPTLPLDPLRPPQLSGNGKTLRLGDSCVLLRLCRCPSRQLSRSGRTATAEKPFIAQQRNGLKSGSRRLSWKNEPARSLCSTCSDRRRGSPANQRKRTDVSRQSPRS